MDTQMDLDALQLLAEQATPGLWQASQANAWHPGMGPFDDYGASITAHDVEVVVGGAQDEQGGAVGVLSNQDAAYIVAAQPQTMLALLRDLRVMETALKQIAQAGAQSDPESLSRTARVALGHTTISQ